MAIFRSILAVRAFCKSRARHTLDRMFGFKKLYFAPASPEATTGRSKATTGRRIYLDHASATPVLPAAADVVYQTMKTFANPGGIHADSVAAKQSLESSRGRIAAHLGCKAREIIFTSGLTEANNIAIVGYARHLLYIPRTVLGKTEGPSLVGTHWIVSSIEHSSVLECFSEAERMGGTVTHIDPEPNGLIASETIANALRPETAFVSLGWGNNEIGTIQPLSQIARIIRDHEKKHRTKIIFHSDAGQAPLYRSPHVHTLGVDVFSLGSGKLYGPRGIGALFVSNRVTLAPVIFGGGQERGLRSGTEDVALAAGFVAALDIVAGERGAESRRLEKLRDEFAERIVVRLRQGFGGQAHIPDAIINGDLKHALPHMLNISISGERSGEYLALQLDHAGISLSTKSACDEGNKSSHVVAALGGEAWRAQNTLRFSLGRDTTEGDLKRALDALAALIRA